MNVLYFFSWHQFSWVGFSSKHVVNYPPFTPSAALASLSAPDHVCTPERISCQLAWLDPVCVCVLYACVYLAGLRWSPREHKATQNLHTTVCAFCCCHCFNGLNTTLLFFQLHLKDYIWWLYSHAVTAADMSGTISWNRLLCCSVNLHYRYFLVFLQCVYWNFTACLVDRWTPTDY